MIVTTRSIVWEALCFSGFFSSDGRQTAVGQLGGASQTTPLILIFKFQISIGQGRGQPFRPSRRPRPWPIEIWNLRKTFEKISNQNLLYGGADTGKVLRGGIMLLKLCIPLTSLGAWKGQEMANHTIQNSNQAPEYFSDTVPSVA